MSKKATTTTATVSKTLIGPMILALNAMITSCWGKKPSGKGIACKIAMINAGMILPVAEQIETGKPLSKEAYAKFKHAAKGEGKDAEGAQKVINMANELVELNKEIAAYKEGVANGTIIPESKDAAELATA